jgi:hypothetical protein
MAWRGLDGRVSIMNDLLSNPQTVSLATRCIDRPALALGGDNKVYLAWTGFDRSVNVMSSDDGMVFSSRLTLPGKSVLAPQ